MFVVIISNQLFANNLTAEITENKTYKIGRMVQTLQQALTSRDAQAQQTILLYGTDSRYCSMIRGWLFQ